MGPGRLLVHGRGAHSTELIATCQQSLDVLETGDELFDVRDVYPLDGILVDLHGLLAVLGKQVTQVLVVDLHVARAQVVGTLRRRRRDEREDLLGRKLQDPDAVAAASHGVGLAAARLPVREDGSVNALDHRAYHRGAYRGVQIWRGGFLAKDTVHLDA